MGNIGTKIFTVIVNKVIKDGEISTHPKALLVIIIINSVYLLNYAVRIKFNSFDF